MPKPEVKTYSPADFPALYDENGKPILPLHATWTAYLRISMGNVSRRLDILTGDETTAGWEFRPNYFILAEHFGYIHPQALVYEVAPRSKSTRKQVQTWQKQWGTDHRPMNAGDYPIMITIAVFDPTLPPRSDHPGQENPQYMVVPVVLNEIHTKTPQELFDLWHAYQDESDPYNLDALRYRALIRLRTNMSPQELEAKLSS